MVEQLKEDIDYCPLCEGTGTLDGVQIVYDREQNLRQQNAELSKKIGQLEAQIAVKDGALKVAIEAIETLHPIMNPQEPCIIYSAWEKGGQALTSDGIDLLAVVEAARRVITRDNGLLNISYLGAIELERAIAKLGGAE